MTTTTAFDTLRFAKRLEASGFPAPQAAGLAEAIAENMLNDLVTRAEFKSEMALLRGEMAQLRTELRAEFSVQMAQMKGELRAEIASVKSDLLRWIIPLFLSQMAFGVGVLLKLS